MKRLILPLVLLCAGALGLFRPAHADPLSSPLSAILAAPVAASHSILAPRDAAGSPVTHILWTSASGQLSLWNLSGDGTFSQITYGPYPGWTAKALSDSTDGRQRVLWTRTDGTISLWILDNTTGAFTQNTFGPYPGWSASAISTAPGLIDHTKLASDPGSLGQVSGGLLSTNDNWHVNVTNDLMVKGTLVAIQGNGGGSGNNGGVGRALVDGGPANNLIINYANDFGRVSVQSELDVHGALGLEPGDIYANNDINIHRNTTVHGTFGVQGGNFGVDGAVNLGDGNINSANDININKNATVNGHFGVNGAVDTSGYISTKSTLYANNLQLTGGSDLAEPYKIAASGAAQPLPGMVVSIDPAQIGQMRVSTHAYDAAVGGIISGAGGVQPGITLRQKGTAADGTLPIACTGRVWCWCDAGAGGAITPGDLLTTSATPGHAMRVGDYDKAKGAILGKAMSPLPSGKGLVLVLVTLE